MDFKTISTIINTFVNCAEIVEFEKPKFVGDCHGDLFQFLLPLANMISINYKHYIDKYNILNIDVKIDILKIFSSPVVYYLGDLFSTNQGKLNEMDYVIEQIIFQILHSSKIVKWIIGNHDIERFNNDYINKYRILNLIESGKILLCDSFKGRILSHTCFTPAIFNKFTEYDFTYGPKKFNIKTLTQIINKKFYDLVKDEKFEQIFNSDIIWNRNQNGCFKSIVGHTPGLRHYLNYEETKQQLFINTTHKRITRSKSFNENEILTIDELNFENILITDKYLKHRNSINNVSEYSTIKGIDSTDEDYKHMVSEYNNISECSTFKGRCKQIFKNDNILDTSDETKLLNKDNLRYVAVIDFGCSYDKSDSPYGYVGISIPDFLYYDGHGIYKLTNLPVYTYLYTVDGIRINKLSKTTTFSRLEADLIINYIYFKDSKNAHIIRTRYCDASIYIHKFIDEFKNENILLKFAINLMMIILSTLIVLKVCIILESKKQRHLFERLNKFFPKL